MNKGTIALYCGSFNPFHVGHLNILERAEAIFGRTNVIVCQGVNPDKNNQLVKPLEKVFKLRYLWRKVVKYTGFTHDLISKYEKEGYNVVLIRGLRGGFDLEAENNQIEYIKMFKPDLKTIYIPCDRAYHHISSSGIRQLEAIEKGSGKSLIVK